MADTFIPPARRRANISRRQLLSAAPLTLTTLPAITAPSSDWTTALAAWQNAAARSDHFFRTYVKGRAYSPELDRLERQLGDLDDIRFHRLHALIATPAPDAPAFLAKFRISCEEHFTDDEQGVAATLLADAEALLDA